MSLLLKIKSQFRLCIQGIFKLFGLAVVRLAPSTNTISRGSMRGAMQSLAQHSLSLNTIVDIGASDGHWAAMAMGYFPLANYLLIEAQAVHKPKLDAFIKEHQNSQYCLAAAGDTEGHIFFDAGNPFGGQASYEPYAQNNIELPVTTIDKQIATRGLSGPYLLKLDTHGFEVPILTGAATTLKETVAIVIECYVQHLTKTSLTFSQMCTYLDLLGFRCIDAVDLEWRPFDNTLWQMDLVFIRKDRPEFTYHDYV